MTKVNGNDGMKNVYFGQNSLNVNKTDKTVKTEHTAPAGETESTAETSSAGFVDFGVGSKQKSDEIRGLQVEGVSRLAKADMEDLSQLSQIAGIPNIYVTQAVYNRISDSVSDIGNVMDTIGTENNAEALFESSEFGTLNNLFGIS